MSHEVESMAWANEVPWHGLGKKVPGDLTTDQMLEAAGLDWEVNKVDCYIDIAGKRVNAGIQALVRSTDNKVLTHVHNSWNPVQNQEAFDFFKEYVDYGDMDMETAGSLKGGRLVWCLARIKETFELKSSKGSDVVEGYMLFTNPHQFGRSVDVRFTPIRVVCWNTLSMALDKNASTNQAVKANHKTVFNASKVKEQLGIAKTYMQQYKEVAELLSSKRFTKDTVNEYFGRVFPKFGDKEGDSRNSEMAFDWLEKQPGGDLNEGTWWQAFNSVTFLTDHKLGRSQESRLSSSWYGVNQQKKLKALKLAKEYAEAA